MIDVNMMDVFVVNPIRADCLPRPRIYPERFMRRYSQRSPLSFR